MKRPSTPSPPRSGIYDRLAPLYDFVYGAGLEPGRRRAMTCLGPRPGERVLEAGIGTGLAARTYPSGVRVTGIDVSWPMLRRAAQRLRPRQRDGLALACMDAGALAFPAGTFDAVYAPYLVNVVPDPILVGLELRRVCRPGGRIVLLNHFAGLAVDSPLIDRVAGHVAGRLGHVDWQVDLGAFLRGTGLTPLLVERVNLAGVTTLVVCRVPTFPSSLEMP